MVFILGLFISASIFQENNNDNPIIISLASQPGIQMPQESAIVFSESGQISFLYIQESNQNEVSRLKNFKTILDLIYAKSLQLNPGIDQVFFSHHPNLESFSNFYSSNSNNIQLLFIKLFNFFNQSGNQNNYEVEKYFDILFGHLHLIRKPSNPIEQENDTEPIYFYLENPQNDVLKNLDDVIKMIYNYVFWIYALFKSLFNTDVCNAFKDLGLEMQFLNFSFSETKVDQLLKIVENGLVFDHIILLSQ